MTGCYLHILCFFSVVAFVFAAVFWRIKKDVYISVALLIRSVVV